MENFEHYIQQKVQNYTVTPSDKVWKNIRKKIHPWYKSLAFKALTLTITASAIIGFSLYKLQKKQRQPKTIKIQRINFSSFTLRQPSNHAHSSNTFIFTPKPHEKNQNTSHPTYKPTYIKPSNSPQKNYASQSPKPIYDSSSAPSLNTLINSMTNKKFKFNLSIYPHHGCAPLQVHFCVKPPKGKQVVWFIDKQAVAKQDSFVFSLNAGYHVVQLIIYDSLQNVVVYDTIVVKPKPKSNFDIAQCYVNKPFKVKNLSVNAVSYSWYFGDGYISKKKNPEHVYFAPGIYKVTLIASNGGCADTSSQEIVVSQGKQNIIFPNAFIPNTSGPNGGYYNPNKPVRDIFYPLTRKPVADYSLQIFDRTGRLIFQTHNILQGWDGYYRGHLVPVGVYIYIAKGHFTDGESFLKKGDVTVIYSIK